jgi:alpha-galactosidase
MMRELTEAFPDILFEGCSGGGGRMDYGILHYMPQYWASDNTDALARLGIQYSTSIFFPPLVMGCHVSAVPNHQTGRVLSLQSRGFVAMSGNLGYELDVTKMSERETVRMAADIAWYKANRSIVQFGRFFRLASPWDGNEAAWLFMSPDGSRAILFWFRLLAVANPGCVRLRLAGLAAEADYRISAISHTMEDNIEPESKEEARMNLTFRDMGLGQVIAGSELLHRGLVFRVPDGDCAGFRVELVRES